MLEITLPGIAPMRWPESYRYLHGRGIQFVHGVLRGEAAAVMQEYRQGGGLIYNA